MASLQAGFSELTITPSIGVDLGGYAGERKAVGIHDELKVSACVLGDGDHLIAVCSVDIIEVNAEITTSVRAALQSHGFSPESVMLAATHTHSGPRTKGDNPLNRQWREQLPAHLTDAILAARDDMRPCSISLTTTEVFGIAGNRRDPKSGPVDRSVTVLRFDDSESDQLLAMFINHACHATTLGKESLDVSADYPGQVRRALKAKLGNDLHVIFLNGACGDLNPGGYSAEASALGKLIPNRTMEHAAQIGDQLAEAVCKASASAAFAESAQIKALRKTVELPLRDLPSPDIAQRKVDACRARLSTLEKDMPSDADLDRARLDLIYAEIWLSQAKARAKKSHACVSAELQAIAIGDIALLGLPGEVFTELGMTLKSESQFEHTLVVGYANDDVGYFPTPAALQVDGYETLVSPVDEEGVLALMDGAREVLMELHDSMRS